MNDIIVISSDDSDSDLLPTTVPEKRHSLGSGNTSYVCGGSATHLGKQKDVKSGGAGDGDGGGGGGGDSVSGLDVNESAVATRNKHRKVPVSHEVIELTDTDSDYAAEEQLLRSRKRPRNGHSAHSSPSQLVPHGRRHFRPRSPAHVMGPSTINAITPRSTRNSVRRLNEQDRKRKGKAVVNRGMLTSNDETDLGESDQDADRSDESSPSRDRHHGRVSTNAAAYPTPLRRVPSIYSISSGGEEDVINIHYTDKEKVKSQVPLLGDSNKTANITTTTALLSDSRQRSHLPSPNNTSSPSPMRGMAPGPLRLPSLSPFPSPTKVKGKQKEKTFSREQILEYMSLPGPSNLDYWPFNAITSAPLSTSLSRPTKIDDNSTEDETGAAAHIPIPILSTPLRKCKSTPLFLDSPPGTISISILANKKDGGGGGIIQPSLLGRQPDSTPSQGTPSAFASALPTPPAPTLQIDHFNIVQVCFDRISVVIPDIDDGWLAKRIQHEVQQRLDAFELELERKREKTREGTKKKKEKEKHLQIGDIQGVGGGERLTEGIIDVDGDVIMGMRGGDDDDNSRNGDEEGNKHTFLGSDEERAHPQYTGGRGIFNPPALDEDGWEIWDKVNETPIAGPSSPSTLSLLLRLPGASATSGSGSSNSHPIIQASPSLTMTPHNWERCAEDVIQIIVSLFFEHPDEVKKVDLRTKRMLKRKRMSEILNGDVSSSEGKRNGKGKAREGEKGVEGDEHEHEGARKGKKPRVDWLDVDTRGRDTLTDAYLMLSMHYLRTAFPTVPQPSLVKFQKQHKSFYASTYFFIYELMKRHWEDGEPLPFRELVKPRVVGEKTGTGRDKGKGKAKGKVGGEKGIGRPGLTGGGGDGDLIAPVEPTWGKEPIFASAGVRMTGPGSYWVDGFDEPDYFGLGPDPRPGPGPATVRGRVGSSRKNSATAAFNPDEWLDELFAAERQWVVEEQARREGKADVGGGQEEAAVEEDDDEEGVEKAECGCCFDDVAITKLIPCPEGHLFCKNCITQLASNALLAPKGPPRASSDEASSSTSTTTRPSQENFSSIVLCPSLSTTCAQPFAHASLALALPQTLFARFEREVQRREIDAALQSGEIDAGTMEECPFCEWRCLMEAGVDEDKLFRCGNEEECEVVSCRTCKKKDHLPKNCQEAEKDEMLEGKHTIEEAMTRALMRNCPKCKKPFIKEGGCNKMTCPSCGTLSCYKCRQIIHGYDHFKGNGPGSSNRCSLHETLNLETLHQQEVDRARQQAIQDYKKAHPEANMEEIEKGLVEEEKKRKRQQTRQQQLQQGLQQLGRHAALPGPGNLLAFGAAPAPAHAVYRRPVGVRRRRARAPPMIALPAHVPEVAAPPPPPRLFNPFDLGLNPALERLAERLAVPLPAQPPVGLNHDHLRQQLIIPGAFPHVAPPLPHPPLAAHFLGDLLYRRAATAPAHPPELQPAPGTHWVQQNLPIATHGVAMNLAPIPVVQTSAVGLQQQQERRRSTGVGLERAVEWLVGLERESERERERRGIATTNTNANPARLRTMAGIGAPVPAPQPHPERRVTRNQAAAATADPVAAGRPATRASAATRAQEMVLTHLRVGEDNRSEDDGEYFWGNDGDDDNIF